jgi:hypothetical protein
MSAILFGRIGVILPVGHLVVQKVGCGLGGTPQIFISKWMMRLLIVGRSVKELHMPCIVIHRPGLIPAGKVAALVSNHIQGGSGVTPSGVFATNYLLCCHSESSVFIQSSCTSSSKDRQIKVPPTQPPEGPPSKQ